MFLVDLYQVINLSSSYTIYSVFCKQIPQHVDTGKNNTNYKGRKNYYGDDNTKH